MVTINFLSSLIVGKKFPYRWQEVPLSLARSSLIVGKKFPFIHFHPKNEKPYSFVIQAIPTPNPSRARMRVKHVKTACCLKHVNKTTRMTRYIFWGFSFLGVF